MKLGIIGVGTIFEMQQEALSMLTEEYMIVAVCDKDRRKWENSSGYSSRVRFYESSGDLLGNPEVESVLIATPPSTHFLLAMDAISAGKNVLLEKPAVLRIGELERLYAHAKKCEVLLHIAYHASFAMDLKWFVKNQKRILQEYGLGRITSIKCGFFDPYMMGREILPGKELLGGSFMDSGVNALSIIARLIDIQDMKEVSHTEQKSTTVYASTTTYQVPGTDILVETGWNLGENEKTTLLGFSDSEDTILLDHSNQRVMYIKKYNILEELYREDHITRLVTHYFGVFREYAKILENGLINKEISLKIHELLMEHSSL